MNTEINILVVDDSPPAAKLLVMTVERMGYRVRTANSGSEALSMISTELPHLILLDVMMPGMNGYVVCQKLKQAELSKDIPVIFVSALNDVQDHVKGFDVGGVDYISKPINIEEVTARVKVHAEHRIQQLEIERLRKREKAQTVRLGEMVAERTEQLRRMNHRMAAILASVTDAIILVHEDGTIDMANKGFDKLFGYAPDELFGQPISAIVPDEFHQLVAEAFDRAQEGETQIQIQVEGIRKNGSTFDIDMSFAQVPVDKNHIVVNCHDITYLKEMERIKDNFISMVTHELRTPITGILLIARQLHQYHARMTQEQFSNKLDQLFTQSKVMAELVESVLDISRLEAQQEQSTRTHRVEMLDVIEGIVSELSASAEEKQQIISISHDSQPIEVSGDSIDFDRIWRNLISNAIKYTPNGGSIKVNLGTLNAKDGMVTTVSNSLAELRWISETAFNEELYCVGQVEDSGYGIGSEDLPQLFERFHRGWAKQSNIPGTGLGLALVKELLTMYQGNIHVDSERSLGTTFTFWIPLTKEHKNDKYHGR